MASGKKNEVEMGGNNPKSLLYLNFLFFLTAFSIIDGFSWVNLGLGGARVDFGRDFASLRAVELLNLGSLGSLGSSIIIMVNP